MGIFHASRRIFFVADFTGAAKAALAAGASANSLASAQAWVVPGAAWGKGTGWQLRVVHRFFCYMRSDVRVGQKRREALQRSPRSAVGSPASIRGLLRFGLTRKAESACASGPSLGRRFCAPSFAAAQLVGGAPHLSRCWAPPIGRELLQV